MASKKEVAAQIMEHLCNHDWHGYSQPNRYGDGEGVCQIQIDGKTYEVAQGDRDCSSAVIDAYKTAGINCGGAAATGNMRSCMVASGNFRWHPMSDGYTAQRGDCYLREGHHTAMCTSAVPDLLAEFSISETGGINGQTGDQTGKESYIHAYYNYPWDGILECIADGQESGGTSTPEPSENVSMPEYRVNAGGTFYEWMHGLQDTGGSSDQYGGQMGVPIQDIEFRNLGPKGWFRLTLDNGTVLGKNKQNGTSNLIRGVEVYYDTPNPGATGYYRAKYRVHIMETGQWLKWEYDNEDGGAGDDRRVIDAIALTVEKE